MLHVRINCESVIYSDVNLHRCSNEKVKRSWFGYGPRYCKEVFSTKECEFKCKKERQGRRPSPVIR